MDAPVLIVGAGPTGLVLALYLAHQGVKARIIDKNEGPGQASRAMVVQARTLELYDQIGLAEEIIARGIIASRFHLWEAGKETAVIEFGEFGKTISPYPYALSFPQDEHEQVLGQKLGECGVSIEWKTELLSFEQVENGVRYELQGPGGKSQGTCRFICGCDGAHSRVRENLQLEFPGGTYEQTMFMADVEASGAVANGDMNACLSAEDFYIVFPIRTSGTFRIIGLMPHDIRDQANPPFEQIAPYVEQTLSIMIDKTRWNSVYHVHHRVAERFRVGKAFLAGDAGHIHSPAGGQGMNTGIGDAINLAWKLAAVLQGRASEQVLDTYEPERIRFARALVESTDRAFQLGSGTGFTATLFRSVFLPHLGPIAFKIEAIREAAFRLVSQTKIEYRHSELSEGWAAEVDAGDRLPWVAKLENYKPLRSLDWQVHVYGDLEQDLMELGEMGIPLHQFEWRQEADQAGLVKDAMYLVRPDGYIGLASGTQDAEWLMGYWNKWGIGLRGASQG